MGTEAGCSRTTGATGCNVSSAPQSLHNDHSKLPTLLRASVQFASLNDYLNAFDPLILEEARDGLKADWAEACVAGKVWEVSGARYVYKGECFSDLEAGVGGLKAGWAETCVAGKMWEVWGAAGGSSWQCTALLVRGMLKRSRDRQCMGITTLA